VKYGKSFWLALAVGGAVMAYGVFGMVAAGSRTHPTEFITYLIGAALFHDLVLVPCVLLVAAGVRRVVPGRLRPPVLTTLLVAAAVSLFAFPFVRGYGRLPDNPSALPGDYPSGLVTVLGVVVSAGALWALFRTLARRRSTG